MKKNNIYILIFVCISFATSTIFASKKLKRAQESLLEVLPTEIVSEIIEYTDPETQKTLLLTSKILQQKTLPQLLDQLVKINIFYQDYRIPQLQENYYSELDVPELIELYKTINTHKKTQDKVYRNGLFNFIVNQYPTEEEKKLFQNHYRDIFLKNFNFLINSGGFFHIITRTNSLYLEIALSIKYHRDLELVNLDSMKDFQTLTATLNDEEKLNTKSEIRRIAKQLFLLEENFETIVAQEKLNQETTFVTITKKHPILASITFLVTNTFANANKLLFDYSSEKVTKLIVRHPWWRDSSPNVINILSNLDTHYIPIVDVYNTSLLSIGCSLSNIDFVNLCLAKKVSWHPDIFGKNPIHQAVIFNTPIQYKTEHGTHSVAHIVTLDQAIIDTIDPNNIIPIIQKLYEYNNNIQFKTNVNKKNFYNGNTPLQDALVNFTYQQDNEEFQPFFHRIENDLPIDVLKNILTLLLDSGTNINIRDFNGDSPLMSCVRWSRTEMAQFLLERGANPNTFTHTLFNGETALGVAIRELDIEIIRILLYHGANPNVYNRNKGSTNLLILTVLYEKIGVRRYDYLQNCLNSIKLLLSYNANPYLISKKNKYPGFSVEDNISAYDYAVKNNVQEVINIFETYNRPPTLIEELETDIMLAPEETSEEDWYQLGIFPEWD